MRTSEPLEPKRSRVVSLEDQTSEGSRTGPPGAVMTRPASLSAAPDLPGLLRAFQRRWRLAVGGGFVLAVLASASAYLLLASQKFTAKALLQVSSTRPRVIFNTNESVSDYRTYQFTQVTLAKSRGVLSGALKQPEVAKLETVRRQTDAIGWLDQELKVDFPYGSEVLTIAMTGDQPNELMVLVNAVTDAYLEQIVGREQDERLRRHERLKALRDRYQDDLRDKRKLYRQLAESVGSNDKQSVALKQQMAAEHLASTRHNLAQLQSDIRKAKTELALLQSEAPEADPDGSRPAARDDRFEARLKHDPVIAQLQTQLAERRVRYSAARRRSRSPSDPAVRNTREAFEAAQVALDDRRLELMDAAGAVAAGEPAPERPRSELDQAETYVELLLRQEKDLKEEIATLDAEIRSFNVKSMDLHWIEDEIELAAAAAKLVGTEVEALNVELLAPPRIQLLERASLPRNTDRSRRLRLSGIVGAGVFALFGIGLSLWEFHARRVETAEQVVNGLGMRLFGALPDISRLGRGLPAGSSQSLMAESIDATRTLLLHASRVEGLRSLMVTSADKGEGKTTLACHLSASLARAGRRTLLIDCDLRKPATHAVLDVRPGPGVCEYLRGEATLESVVQATPVAGLALIAAGRCDLESMSALHRDVLRPLIDELKGQYDFVIIDSPPTMLVTDSLVLSQYADAVVFSVLRGVSRLPMVFAAYERLAMLDVRILGSVVAGTRGPTQGYAGGYGYGYGSAYPYPSAGSSGGALEPPPQNV